jgi:hypothetical protein
MNRYAIALVALALSANALAEPPKSGTKDIVTGSAQDELSLNMPRTGVTLKITDQEMTGTLLQLGRYPGNVLRGRFKQEPAEIHWTDDRVTGQIGGGAPLNLKIRRTEEGLKIDGLYRGVQSHFRIGYGVFEGRISSCRYTLTAEKDEYTGERTCDHNVTEPVTLRIPRKIASRSPGEIVAILAAAFLGQRE